MKLGLKLALTPTEFDCTTAGSLQPKKGPPFASAKRNVDTFWRRKRQGRKCLSVSRVQVSVGKLYPFRLQEEEADPTRPLGPAPNPAVLREWAVNPPGQHKQSGASRRLCTHTHAPAFLFTSSTFVTNQFFGSFHICTIIWSVEQQP